MVNDGAEGQERVFNVGILGSNHEITKLVGECLGTPDEVTDLQFFNRLDTALGYIFTGVAPVGYPEKLKTLLQACSLTEIHIMVLDAETGITPAIGEIMICMDHYARYYNTKILGVIGNITSANEWRVADLIQKFPKIAKGTLLETMAIYPLKERGDFDRLKRTIVDLGLTIPRSDPATAPYMKVVVDHAFNVKGVGTVILGVVKQGILTAGEMIQINGQKVILRSIQKQDRDFKTAIAGDRVGLALKGIKAEEIDRNSIITSLNAYISSANLNGELVVSPYYKPPEGSISSSNIRQYYLVIDLAGAPVKIVEGAKLKPGEKGLIQLKSDKEFTYDPKGFIGIFADFGVFENKSRIVGAFIMKM